jgi:hypothetical protein
MRRALVLLLGLLPASAGAAGRGETAVGAGPALAVLHQTRTRAGAALDARFLYGLSDVLSAHAGLTVSRFAASDDAPTTVLTAPAVGLTAAADVLDWVPFAQAALVLADLRGGGSSQQRLGAGLAIGADHLISRHLALTVLARIDHYTLQLAGRDGAAPLKFVLALQVGRVF